MFNWQSRLTKHPAAAKQAIKLTGLGTEPFNEATEALLALTQAISRQLPPGALLPSTPDIEQGFIVLEFSNRYFTAAQDILEPDATQIPQCVDPFGILRSCELAGSYTQDNHVLYFERQAGSVEEKQCVCNITASV